MSQLLFRKEALAARRTQWLGAISLAQPLRLWVLTLGAGMAALTVVLFLVLGSYTRRSTVTGQLVPNKGLVTVLAPATGVISQLDHTEGDTLQAGQRLAVVVTPRVTPEGGDTQVAFAQGMEQRHDGLVSMQAAQQSQLQAQASGLRAQLAAARRELAQIETEVATRQDQTRIAGETLAKLKQLEDARYVSVLQIKQQESTALEYTGQAQALQRQAIAARRGIAQLEQALRELPGQQQATQAALQRDLAQLGQERAETEARGALAVSAPVSGMVATQLVKPGQAVQAGQPLMSLLPKNSELEVELLVPSRAIGFIELGDSVQLRYQAYPYQKFGHQLGKVVRISRSALSQGELGNAQQGEPFYRITVALARQSVTAYGKAELLRPGMLLDADVFGEKRRLIEWVFEPLYSLQGKVSA
ncbi:HlyD family efflux transporter periplasmic adaptor subunit [Thermomonas sp. HDW16]|uniref:HlyD family secretion protein n=1 Tax=Thermomonas sp. HDW16 TaxID=2714945 RepID=UPI00140BEA0A|nr:HlyD family efflux transporter periplasmic adaptor subunit [Thermomonas sp. HDW16]QIL21159.1 HlyD family efflux transporter periplasmic adaptor subunit [Thermomonas sp. HDW16]